MKTSDDAGELRRLALEACRMKKPEDAGKPRLLALKLAVLKQFVQLGVQLTKEEAAYEANNTTADDFDEDFLRALNERHEERVRFGYDDIQHPTTKMFEIGIDSIRQGKPSPSFLTLLEEIGKCAEDNDVMAALFKGDFPREIKTNTIEAARKEAKIIEKFKVFIREKYLTRPRRAKILGADHSEPGWDWIAHTMSEGIADFKITLPADQVRAFDRALSKHERNFTAWRDLRDLTELLDLAPERSKADPKI
jgi:hypothetical protein